MMNKKGILMPLIVILFTLLLSYAAYVFIGGRSGAEETLELGEMVKDIYIADQRSKDLTRYLDKVGEYLLLDAIKTRIKKGIPVKDGCDALYEDEDCDLDLDELAESVVKEIREPFEKSLISVDEKPVFSKDYEYVIKLVGENITLKALSNRVNDFGFSGKKKLEYKKSVAFSSKLKFNFSEYLKMEDILKENSVCLSNAEDEQVKDDISAGVTSHTPESCLVGTKFKNVRKINNVLSFDYEVKGALLEKTFKGPVKVDLNGFNDIQKPKDIT